MLKIYHKFKNKRRQKFEREFFQMLEPFLDFSISENQVPSKIKKITFVLPKMFAHSGGHTSVLRLGTELANMGYDVTYTSFLEQDLEEMKRHAQINLSNYKGDIKGKDELFNIESDVVIATSWESAYFIKKMTGYKMYFVQDFEPYFFMYGEHYLLAQKTYELGHHMVSLGSWNADKITKNCNLNSKVEYIDFPYEAKEYALVKRNYDEYKNKKEFKIAVYVKDTGKRAPYLIQNILKNLVSKFDSEGIKLIVKYYGEDKEFACEGGENLGKLSKDQLFELYKECDFGMVASLTNISLVPYEMLATGLPVIEFKEGTYKYFLGEDTCILTSFDWRELYYYLKEYMDNPIKLEEKVVRGTETLKSLSWNKSANEFKDILENILVKVER